MPIPDLDFEDWNANRKLVLLTLERIEGKVDKVDVKVEDKLYGMGIKLAELEANWKTYTAIIAVVASAVIAAIVSYVMKKVQ